MSKLAEPILITGATGFIGANLVHRLVQQYSSVFVLLRPDSDTWRLQSITQKVNPVYSDITQKSAVQKTLNDIKPQTIFHLASYGNASFHSDIMQMIQVNIMGTTYVLSASKNHRPRSIVVVGTSSEYGSKNEPMYENMLLEPNSYYAITKATATHLSRVLSKAYNFPIVVVRPFSVYGPYEDKVRFIPTIIRNLLTGQSIKLVPGITRHDFIYIDDVVKQLIQCATHAKKISGEVINLGTGIEYTNSEVVHMLFDIAKKSVPINTKGYPKKTGDNVHWVANINHANQLLHIKKRHSLKKGLTKTYQWFLKNKKLYV